MYLNHVHVEFLVLINYQYFYLAEQVLVDLRTSSSIANKIHIIAYYLQAKNTIHSLVMLLHLEVEYIMCHVHQNLDYK